MASLHGINMKPIMYHSDFKSHPYVDDCYCYNDGYGYSNMRFEEDGKMYVYNVEVFPEYRGQGFGRGMMTKIRDSFPQAHIFVDTTPKSDSFWVKMVEEGVIDSIRNHNVITEYDDI